MAGDLPKQVHLYTEELTLNDKNKEALRNKAVIRFLSEQGGYVKDGIKYVTNYRYNVEKLKDGRLIYLLKPTWLNKGIDFQVMVEKFKDGKDARPSHKDIFEDLKIKKQENKTEYDVLKKIIHKIWLCENPDDVLKTNKLTFGQSHSVELILKSLKWLFIEQDITYWNYDGRGMLKREIDKI